MPGVRYDADDADMTDYFLQLFTALRGVRLSERERANLRLQIQAYMLEHPLQAPLSSRILNACKRAGSNFVNALNSRSPATHPAFAACVLVLCIGVGTSYAASTALPGEPLYSFKTRVNEPLQGALALTPAAKAAYSAELTNVRLEEAEELAASGKLTPVASAAIESGLDVAVSDFNTNVSKLSEQDDSGEAADAQSNLEASLNAHETVLASLTAGGVNADISPIVSLVHDHAEKISEGRYAAEVSLAKQDGPGVRTAALRKKKTAQDEIVNAALLSADATGTVVATSVTSITAEAESDVTDGNSEAKQGRWGKAFGAFQAAIRKMKETRTSINATEKLRAQLSLNAAATTSVTSTSVAATTSATSTSDDSGSSTKDKKDDGDKGKGSVDLNIQL